MNDRELLEKAAKAANYPIEFDGEVNGYFPNGRDENGNVAEWWNPLTDDGDCARLESACELGITWLRGFVISHNTNHKEGYYAYEVELYSDHGGDKNAARRRASTRAAAKLAGE